MPEDPADARAALAAEAERLKAERLASEANEKHTAEQNALERERDEASFDARRMAKSMRHLGVFTVAGMLFIVGGMVALSPPEGSPEGALSPIGFPFIGAGVLVLGYFFTGMWRYRSWEAKLPFKLVHWDHVLGAGKAVTKVGLELYFKDTAAPFDVVNELVKARLDRETVKTEAGPPLTVIAELERVGTNYPSAKWGRKAVDKVLLDVHKAYPLESVRMKALSVGEFYVPSGD